MASTPRRIKAFAQLQHLSASRLGNGSSSLRRELRPEDIPEPQKGSDAEAKMMNADGPCIPRVDSWVVAEIFHSRYDSKVGQFELKEVMVKRDDNGGVAVYMDVEACLEWWEG